MNTKDLANKAYAAARDALAQGDYDMARAALRWARHADSGNPLYMLAEAVLAQRTGDHHEAELLYRRALDMAERAIGPGHMHNVAIAARLLALYEEAGRDDQARALQDRIIDGLDRASAADASIPALDRLAEICVRAGRAGEAIAIYQAAFERRSAVYGNGHRRAVECLVALTRLRARIRDLAEARAAQEEIMQPRFIWRHEERVEPVQPA